MNNDRFKFRVWDNVKKKYDYLECLYLSQSGGVCYLDMDGHLTYPNEDEDYIVEQCTGLKDKNGKLIYEGDIVLFVGKVNLAVQYTPNEWEMAGDDVNVPLTKNTARFVKIVGNIHEGVKE